jgi:hypothetical protein
MLGFTLSRLAREEALVPVCGDHDLLKGAIEGDEELEPGNDVAAAEST